MSLPFIKLEPASIAPRADAHVSSSQHLTRILDALGISADRLAGMRLPFHPLAIELTDAETDASGMVHQLTPEAAQAWRAMKQAAGQDGIVLDIVSAFRDIDCQADIIRDKISRAMPMEKILTLSAPPGYSEHHTGRAVDINTPGCDPREAPFADTDAFDWLSRHAGRFGFVMSYPMGNAAGLIYEPWHWCYQPQRPQPENMSDSKGSVA